MVWNPLTGEKALHVESAEETGGAHVVADFAVERGGFVPGGEHVHDFCAEHFEVREGRITFVVDGEERTLGTGEELTVQPGSWHRWWNAGEGEVRMRARVEPALRFQEAILVSQDTLAYGRDLPGNGDIGDLLLALGETRVPWIRPMYLHPAHVNERLLAKWSRAHPDRFAGLAGIDPFRGMEGVRELERAVREFGFVGAHLYPHHFELAPDHAKYYPYYAKCCELDHR